MSLLEIRDWRREAMRLPCLECRGFATTCLSMWRLCRHFAYVRWLARSQRSASRGKFRDPIMFQKEDPQIGQLKTNESDDKKTTPFQTSCRSLVCGYRCKFEAHFRLAKFCRSGGERASPPCGSQATHRARSTFFRWSNWQLNRLSALCRSHEADGNALLRVLVNWCIVVVGKGGVPRGDVEGSANRSDLVEFNFEPPRGGSNRGFADPTWLQETCRSRWCVCLVLK